MKISLCLLLITVYLFFVHTMTEWKALHLSLTPHLDYLIGPLHMLPLPAHTFPKPYAR